MPKIIKVENKLRKKVGFGEISEALIQKAESCIQNNSSDFNDIASPCLFRLRERLQLARENTDIDKSALIQNLIEPVMELKANGLMFKYSLVGQLAAVMLSFLEHLIRFDKDAFDIVDAHEKTLSLIISKSISGNGGKLGEKLISELGSACERYYKKNPNNFINVKT